ncbi:MAG: hypothetical protein ACRC0V_06650 [Fusobacteriaceae bacterium]
MKFKIGDTIYKPIQIGMGWGYNRYIIKDIISSELEKENYYIAECLTCKDHDACAVQLKQGVSNTLIFDKMLNNNTDEDDQTYWHKDNFSFYPSQLHAEEALSKHCLDFTKKNLEKEHNRYKATVESLKKQIDTLDLKIKRVQEELALSNAIKE